MISEFQAGEDYKFMLYVIRFVNACAPSIAYMGVLEMAPEFFKMRKKHAEAGKLSKLVIGLMVFCSLLTALSGHLLASSSGLKDLQVMAAVLQDSYLLYLLAVKEGAIALASAIAVAYVYSVIMEKDGLETKR